MPKQRADVKLILNKARSNAGNGTELGLSTGPATKYLDTQRRTDHAEDFSAFTVPSMSIGQDHDPQFEQGSTGHLRAPPPQNVDRVLKYYDKYQNDQPKNIINLQLNIPGTVYQM